jgi:hypothetical protein
VTKNNQGLKHYKSDWMAVWQYVVPHRDPVLLPRQWRVALGTQKSYKLDSPKRAKRRLYESQRRKLKATTTECGQPVSDKEVCYCQAKNLFLNLSLRSLHMRCHYSHL